MGVLAFAAPPCLSLGMMVMMCAPLGHATNLAVPVSTRFSYAQTLKEGYGGVVDYGATITARELAAFGPPNPTSVTCSGSTCVGLAVVSGFQYPALSHDAGRRWGNAGHWFAGAWADGPAFAARISVAGRGVYVAWPSLTGVYLTGDAGRVWYAVATPGRTTSVRAHAGAIVLTVVGSGGRAKSFASRDGGRTWSRGGA